MSCNGCRVLRKGCSDSCILRSSLQSIDSAEAQGHATVFVAKFFGRAGMISLISAVDESQRPAVFQSLLYEACGRTVNPVHGAVGLLWSGNWSICQAAVDTVLKGGALKPLPSHASFGSALLPFPSIPPFLLPTSSSDALPPPPVFTKPSQPLPHRLSVDAHHPCPKQRTKKRKLPSPSSDQQSQASFAAVSPHTINTDDPHAQHTAELDAESEMRTASDGRHSPPLALDEKPPICIKHPQIDPPQLIAPVPRRIKPVMVSSQGSDIASGVNVMPDSVKASLLRTEKNHADDDRLLNLSLSLALGASKSPRIGSFGVNTVWSPCALSEGSVTTSLDSAAAAAAAAAELSIRSCAREAGHGERRPFLNLL